MNSTPITSSHKFHKTKKPGWYNPVRANVVRFKGATGSKDPVQPDGLFAGGLCLGGAAVKRFLLSSFSHSLLENRLAVFEEEGGAKYKQNCKFETRNPKFETISNDQKDKVSNEFVYSRKGAKAAKERN